MKQQGARVRLASILILGLSVAGFITTQNAASSVPDIAQAIQPEVTASVTPRPTYTTVSYELLAERALEVSRPEGFGKTLTVDDLDRSQAVFTTFDQFTRKDGDYAHYGEIFFTPDEPGHRPVFIIPIPEGRPESESIDQQALIVFLFADNGEKLNTMELYFTAGSASATPAPLIFALPPRDENGVLPLDHLLRSAYWSVKYAVPEDFTLDDMDVSQAIITTARQWNAYSADRSVIERPPITASANQRRPVFLMRFTGGDFAPIYLRPPGATPSKFDKAIITIWADTGENFGGVYAEVGKPLMDLSPLKEYGLPFYIPTATLTP